MYLTLAVGFAGQLWRRRPLSFPYAPFFLLFLVSTVVSFPLNVKELWLELQVQPWRELLDGIRRADLHDNVNYVRVILDVASGIGLYVLVVSHRWRREALLSLWAAAAVLATGVMGVGLALYWFPPGGEPTRLSLWLGGNWTGGFSGLGFNVSYSGQYAVTYLPFAAMLLVDEAIDKWFRAAGAASLLLMVGTILAAYQRGALVVLLVEMGLLLLRGPPCGSRWPCPASERRWGAVAVLLALSLLGPGLMGRAVELWQQGDRYRTEVLGAAWRMFLDQPLLGIGSGRFAHQFAPHGGDLSLDWGSLSAHVLYVQILAEQGVVGAATFVAILVIAFTPILRRRVRPAEGRTVLLALAISLAGWLVYGWLQYTFLMRAMQNYFWIAIGLLVHAAGVPPARTLVRATWPVLLVLLVVAAGTALRVQATLA